MLKIEYTGAKQVLYPPTDSTKGNTEMDVSDTVTEGIDCSANKNAARQLRFSKVQGLIVINDVTAANAISETKKIFEQVAEQ